MTKKAFETFLFTSGRQPSLIETDVGKEIVEKTFTDFWIAIISMKKIDIFLEEHCLLKNGWS